MDTDTMFDQDFEDEDFAEIDSLIEYLETLSRPEVLLLNPSRVEQLRFSTAMIKRVLRETGSNAQIECKPHEFEPSVGVVRVEGVALEIKDLDGFARAAEFASNTEVYPLANNKVRMTLTFHGLLNPIE